MSNNKFFFIFDQKKAAILNFEKYFKVLFRKAQLDPRKVIVWKFEGPTSNGLGATRGTYTHTHTHTHIHRYPQSKQ